MTRFYVELMGFVVEWQPDPDNVYLSSGTDNLALHRPAGGELGGHPDKSSEGAQRSALDHLGILVRHAEDVDRWAAFLEGRGVAMSARPRTHRDGARSCYFADPDGNSVQIIYHPPISGT